MDDKCQIEICRKRHCISVYDRSVRFKLKVDKVDVPREDGNYWIDSAPNDNTYKLTLVAEYNGNLLKEEVLKRMGFKGGALFLILVVTIQSCLNILMMFLR